MLIKKSSPKFLQFLCLVWIVCLSCIGCGGGTVGTGIGSPGIERSIEGSVQYAGGNPIANATITILETGETTTTNAQGQFAIKTTATNQEIKLEIATTNTTEQIAVMTDPTRPNDVIQVNISVDPVTKVTTVKHLDVSAVVHGNCDPYFENGRTIRQSVALPSGTDCQVLVQVLGDGKPLARIPFIIQHSDCNQKVWHLESDSLTNSRGVGEAGFQYIDDTRHCFYRVVVPYNVKGLDSTTFLVYTFQAQSAGK